jgi:hypothetical protein
MQDWTAGLVFVLIISTACIAGYLRKKADRNNEMLLVQVLSELAKQTGLTYIPASGSVFLRTYSSPSVEGNYRGRQIFLRQSLIDSDHPEVPLKTHTTIWVDNEAHFRLAIKKMGVFERVSETRDFSSGNEYFDRHFRVKGEPREFVQRAIWFVGSAESHILAWMKQSDASIELHGSDLVVWQNIVPADLSVQNNFLNLLCDLAELTEDMCDDPGRQVAKAGRASLTGL